MPANKPRRAPTNTTVIMGRPPAPAASPRDDRESERVPCWLAAAATAAGVVYAAALARQLQSGADRADLAPVLAAAIATSALCALAAGSVFCRMYWPTQTWWDWSPEVVRRKQRDARRELGLAGATLTGSAALWMAWRRPEAGYLATIGIALIPIVASLLVRGWLNRRVRCLVDRRVKSNRSRRKYWPHSARRRPPRSATPATTCPPTSPPSSAPTTG